MGLSYAEERIEAAKSLSRAKGHFSLLVYSGLVQASESQETCAPCRMSNRWTAHIA